MPKDTSPPASPFDDAAPIDAASRDTPAPPAERLANPRISILHLMAWTATSAAMMAVLRLPREAADQLSAFEMGYRIAFAMYAGVVTGGVLMWFARNWRGLPFPKQPGEWLLVEQGGVVLLSLAMAFIGANSDRAGGPAAFLLIATFAGGLLVIALVPAIQYRTQDAWRVFFWVLVGLAALPLLSMVAMIFAAMFAGTFIFGVLGFMAMANLFLAAVVFLVAVAVDLRRGTVRGWVHWTGVWSLFLITAFHFLMVLAMQFIYRTRF